MKFEKVHESVKSIWNLTRSQFWLCAWIYIEIHKIKVVNFKQNLHFIVYKCHCKCYQIDIKLKKSKRKKKEIRFFCVFWILIYDNFWTNQRFWLVGNFQPVFILTVKRVHFRICVLEVDYIHSLYSINLTIDYFYYDFTLNNMLLASRWTISN